MLYFAKEELDAWLLQNYEPTVDADGVLLFDEVYVPGGGTLGYLADRRAHV